MDAAFLLAAADAFRRLAEASIGPAERADYESLTDQARRLVEAQHTAADDVQLAAVNDHGRIVGQGHHNAKLSDEDIDLMHELRSAGLSHGQIAAKFDDGERRVARSTVSGILTGRRRSHTVMGHRLIVRSLEPVCWPAGIHEFEDCSLYA